MIIINCTIYHFLNSTYDKKNSEVTKKYSTIYQKSERLIGSESLMSICNRKVRVLISTNALHYSLYIFFECKCFN